MKDRYGSRVADIPNGNDVAMDHVEALEKFLLRKVYA
jgi:hypothetical protein